MSTERLSILHVLSAGEVGGAERMVVDLARDQDDTHAFALFAPAPKTSETDPVRAFFRASGVPLFDRGPVSDGPFGTLRRSFGSDDVSWLVEIVRRERIDVVHVHTFGAQGVGTRAAIATGRALVRTEHSTRIFDDPSCWVFARRTLPKAHVSCAVSEDVRRTAHEQSPAVTANMRVVPNGVDLARFPLLPRLPIARARAREAETRGPRLVVVGRLEPRKGVDLVLEAVSRLPHVTLDVVGDGPSGPALREHARRLGLLGRTRFLGATRDVSAALAEADFVVSGARKEGLGLALLEAMASGRPVVAPRVGGIGEFLRDGETGFLAEASAPNERVTALTRALDRALATPASALEALVARARAEVETRYSLEAMHAGYRSAYRDARALVTKG